MTLEQLAQHRAPLVAAYWCLLAACSLAGAYGVAALIDRLNRPRRA